MWGVCNSGGKDNYYVQVGIMGSRNEAGGLDHIPQKNMIYFTQQVHT